MKDIKPNDAHYLILQLQSYFDVNVITTNVDDLHEKAGSNNVYHLHGTLSKIKSSYNSDAFNMNSAVLYFLILQNKIFSYALNTMVQ